MNLPTIYDADAYLRQTYSLGEDIIRVDGRVGPRRTTVRYRHDDDALPWTMKVTFNTFLIKRWREAGEMGEP